MAMEKVKDSEKIIFWGSGAFNMRQYQEDKLVFPRSSIIIYSFHNRLGLPRLDPAGTRVGQAVEC